MTQTLTAEQLLERAAELQTQFWDALGDLEKVVGVVLDATRDLAGLTIEDLREEENEDELSEIGNVPNKVETPTGYSIENGVKLFKCENCGRIYSEAGDCAIPEECECGDLVPGMEVSA